MSNNNILELNDFISYDVEREFFIIRERTIKIKAQEFSINNMSPQSNKEDYKKFLREISVNSIIPNFTSIKQIRKKKSYGNSRWRGAKNAIENFIKKSVFVKEFNIFKTDRMWLWIK